MKSKTLRIAVVALLVLFVCTTVQAQQAHAVWLWGVPWVPEPMPWFPYLMCGYIAAMYVYSWYTDPANQQYIYDFYMNYFAGGGW